MAVTPLEPKKIDNIGVYGVIRESSVDSNLIPDGAVVESVNFNFDRIGAATVRPGIATLGSSIVAGYLPVGLFNVQNSTAIVAFDSASSIRIFRYTGSSWTSTLSGLTSSSKLRFVDFSGRTIMVNGTYDSIRVWDGLTTDTWATSGNPINSNQFASDASVNTQTLRAKFCEVYKDRVYLSGDATSPDRLFFSSVIGTTGNISWTPSTDYVDINPSDGENITALKRFSLELLIFKPNYIYRFRTAGTDPDPLIKIGTRSQESIVEGKRGIYFFHDTGFYRYSGGYPSEISRQIFDIVKNIPYSQYSNIIGWNDQDHIYWSIGTVSIPETIQTVKWKNVVLRYTESSDVWTMYSYSSDVRRAITFNNGTSISRIIALDNGVVSTMDSGTTDLGEPIQYRIRTKWYFWDSVGTRKIIQEIVAICEKAQLLELMYQVDEQTDWQTIGQLKKMVNYFYPLSIRFHRIRFQITGSSRFDGSIFRSIEIISGINEGIIREPQQL